jgi:hypothetical protein
MAGLTSICPTPPLVSKPPFSTRFAADPISGLETSSSRHTHRQDFHRTMKHLSRSKNRESFIRPAANPLAPNRTVDGRQSGSVSGPIALAPDATSPYTSRGTNLAAKSNFLAEACQPIESIGCQ